MLSPEPFSAVAVLLGTAVVGVIAHELSHAVALRVAGVTRTVEFLPERAGGPLAAVRGPLARVTPRRLLDDLSPWQIRAAAVTPPRLAVPFGTALLGAVPDPFAGGDPSLEPAAVAWLGCSLPSPQDSSLLWYPERAIARHFEAEQASRPGPTPADG